ncbi:MAG: glycoside hydrolase family 9 protein [Gammaproteobacteria bacterium]|nr:glycoside hydrolase family 9 protein [Gammaproteobacteria bacterium]
MYRHVVLLIVVLLQSCGQGEDRDDTSQTADQPPRVELLGPSQLELEQGQTYVEPGVQVTDDEDGVNQPVFTVEGQVDVNEPGTHVLQYVAVDSAGNASAPVSRTVSVLPSTTSSEPPVVVNEPVTLVVTLAAPDAVEPVLVATTAPIETIIPAPVVAPEPQTQPDLPVTSTQTPAVTAVVTEAAPAPTPVVEPIVSADPVIVVQVEPAVTTDSTATAAPAPAEPAPTTTNPVTTTSPDSGSMTPAPSTPNTSTTPAPTNAAITLTMPGVYAGHGPSTSPIYNYGSALQMAWYFYEAQRSGPLPKFNGDLPLTDPRTGVRLHNGFLANRIPWRGDSDLRDGADVGLDLTGGWHDAGDHVKFGLPMAFSASILAWGVLEFDDALIATDQMKWAKDNLRWVADYFVKAHPSANVFYGQVGMGATDHSIWGAPEVMPHQRPAWKIDMQMPGPDLALQTSAALTSISMVFRQEEPEYARVLLQHAKELYEFGMATLGPAPNLGHYSDSIADAKQYYASRSGAKDDLPFAAAWLYKATKDPRYLHDAEAYYTPIADNTGHKGWTLVWDDVRYGVYVLMAEIYSDADYVKDSLIGSQRDNGYYDYNLHAQNFLNHWLRDGGIYRTPGGMAWLAPWASARYNTATAFLAMVYRKHLQQLNVGQQLQENYLRFATEQVNYVLGDNPLGMSYMVGFGDNYSQVAHHRSSHGSTTNSLSNPAIPRHVLYGGLAGGPSKADTYTTDRSSFAMTEVATDMNAGFNGVLAALVSAYGIEGNRPDANFPPAGPHYDEIYLTAKLQTKQVSELGSGVLVTVVNESAYPPRHSNAYRFRYFVDLSEIFQAGYTLNDVILDVYWDEAGGGVSLQRWQDSAYIFYVEGRFDGTFVTPLGKDKKQKNIEFLLRLPWVSRGWNPSNDPSYQGLVANVAVMTDKIALYDMNQPAGKQLIWGSEPPPGLSQSQVAAMPPVASSSQNTASFSIKPNVYNSWTNGNCVKFEITNTGAVSGSPAGFQFTLPASVAITNAWNGLLSRSGDVVDVRLQNLGTIAPGGMNDKFGYCAAANVAPSMSVAGATVTESQARFEYSAVIRNANFNGYCADFTAKNIGNVAGTPSLLEFAMPSSQSVMSATGGQVSQSGEVVRLPLTAVPSIAVGGSADVASVCVGGGIVAPSFARDVGGALLSPSVNSFSAYADVYSQWATGYCVNIYITNTGSSTATPRYLGMGLDSATVISNSWNGTISREASQLLVALPTAIKSLLPGESRKDFGFCTAGSGQPSAVLAR